LGNATKKQLSYIDKIVKALLLDHPNHSTFSKQDASDFIGAHKEAFGAYIELAQQKKLNNLKREMQKLCALISLDYNKVIKAKKLKDASDFEDFTKEIKSTLIHYANFKDVKKKDARPFNISKDATFHKNTLRYWHTSLTTPNFDSLSLGVTSSGLVSNLSIFSKVEGVEVSIPEEMSVEMCTEYNLLRYRTDIQEALDLAVEEKSDAGTIAGIAANIVYGGFYSRGKDVEGKAFFVLPVEIHFDENNAPYVSPPKEGEPYFNPFVLEPASYEKGVGVTIGDVSRLNKMVPPEEYKQSWQSYYAYAQDIFKTVTLKPLEEFEYKRGKGMSYQMKAFVSTPKEVAGSNVNILSLQVALSHKKDLPLLLKNIIKPSYGRLRNQGYYPFLYKKLLVSAHIDETYNGIREVYPLDPSQREALYFFTRLEEGEVLAVNGPPGTGKTSMLKGVIASLLARNTRRSEKIPSLVIACGATNQSVTNIIGSFSSFALQGHGDDIKSRWIKGVHSYGWYFPAASKVDEDEMHKYQLMILKKGKVTLGGAASTLNESLQENKPEQFVDFFLDRFQAVSGKRLMLEESLGYLYRMFSMCSADITKEIKASFLKNYIIKTVIMKMTSRESMEIRVRKNIDSIIEKYKNEVPAKIEIPDFVFKNLMDSLFEYLSDKSDKNKENFLEAIEGFLDCTFRTIAFHAISRYWEGRFIQKLLDQKNNDEVSIGIKDYAMLAPCIVGTFQRMPKLFEHNVEYGEDKNYRYSYADLLIVDEAGQATPEVGACLFSLAKKALVVGDTYQIEPVWNLSDVQDKTIRAQLTINNTTSNTISSQGQSVSNGSIMQMAQHASRYSRKVTDDPYGLMLNRHYRCVPGIIDFCNTLVYKNQLIPFRKEEENPLFHPFTYVESKGKAFKSNGSWANTVEAELISRWLCEKYDKILEYYKASSPDIGIHDIVAIVTPFKSQIEVIKDALMCRAESLQFAQEERDSFSKVVIGTTHALQGAERPIVLFSCVTTKEDNSDFIDRSSSLLNVAVSRAKNSFILFGDYERFIQFDGKVKNAEASSLPTMVLKKYMSMFAEKLFPRKIVVVESPGKIKPISQCLGVDYACVATKGHFRELVSVSIENDYATDWKTKGENSGLLEALHLLKECDVLYLAMDDDREGELIAWHFLEYAKNHISRFTFDVRRCYFHEIAESSLRKAIDQAVYGINQKRKDAALARTIIDFLISKHFNSEIQEYFKKKGLGQAPSVGRLKNVLLHIAQDLKNKRQANGSQSYRVKQSVLVNGDAPKEVLLMSAGKVYMGKEEAEVLCANPLANTDSEVFENVTTQEVERVVRPLDPPNTLRVLKEAYVKLGFDTQKTSALLQRLYEEDI